MRVVWVDRGGVHPDEHLAGPRLRVRHVRVARWISSSIEYVGTHESLLWVVGMAESASASRVTCLGK
jgi:hypothetical protein